MVLTVPSASPSGLSYSAPTLTTPPPHVIIRLGKVTRKASQRHLNAATSATRPGVTPAEREFDAISLRHVAAEASVSMGLVAA